MIKLYDYWRSGAAYRLRIGLNLKGVEYVSAPVNIAPGQDEQHGVYKALNPQARVPAIETEHGLLTQSLAILDWLDETHPAPPFLSADPWVRAQERAFAYAVVCDIHPLNNVSPLLYLRDTFGADEAAVKAWVTHWGTRGLTALEAEQARRPERAFCFGDTPGLADICLVPQLAGGRRFQMDMSAYPRLAAIDERARAHPAFAKAAPQNQSDAPKAS